jgi:hypothetical protein
MEKMQIYFFIVADSQLKLVLNNPFFNLDFYNFDFWSHLSICKVGDAKGRSLCPKINGLNCWSNNQT